MPYSLTQSHELILEPGNLVKVYAKRRIKNLLSVYHGFLVTKVIKCTEKGIDFKLCLNGNNSHISECSSLINCKHVYTPPEALLLES